MLPSHGIACELHMLFSNLWLSESLLGQHLLQDTFHNHSPQYSHYLCPLIALFYNYLCVCLFLPFPIDCELFRGTNYILLNFAWPALNTEISTKQTNNEFVEWKHEQMKGVKGISFWGPWKNDGNVNNNYPLLRVKNLVGALYTLC